MKSSWPPPFPASPSAAQPLPASLLCPCLPLCSAQGSSALAWFLQKPSTAPQLPWRALVEGRVRASALTGQCFPAGLHRAVPLKKHNHPINIQSLITLYNPSLLHVNCILLFIPCIPCIAIIYSPKERKF